MKRIVEISALAILFAMASCNKSDTAPACGRVATAAAAGEAASVRDYINANNISAVADERGFYYSIKRAGDTMKPTVCSEVQVNYSVRLTNGTRVDAGTQTKFILGNLIVGWQEGIPLIGSGGSITLYVPPSLGYGAQARDNIPANSILVFDIELLSFR